MKRVRLTIGKSKYERYMIKKDVKDWFKINLFGIISICMMIIIFLFSSQNGTDSSELSTTINNFCSKLFGLNLVLTMFNIRKIAHFILYAILGTTIFTHLRYKYCFPKKFIYYVVAFALTFIYACSDELHQYFVPGRGSQITDVIIDSTGCLVALIINLAIISSLEKHNKQSTV